MRAVLRSTVAVISLLLIATPAFAQPQSSVDVAKLTPLANEPSRGDLFEIVKESASAADKQSARQTFNLYGPFRFPNDALFDVVANQPRLNSLFGVDISHYTDDGFPFADLRTRKIEFVYIKASQGTRYIDPKFGKFWTAASQLQDSRRVHRGAYHFLSANADGAKQADTFLAVLAHFGGLSATDMPPVVDLEWDKLNKHAPDRWASKTPAQILAGLQAFLERVKAKTGRTPVIYTSPEWWKSRIGNYPVFSTFSTYPLWVADYSKSSRGSETPGTVNGTPSLFWQYTDSAQMALGFNQGFDANIFKGQPADFYQKLGVQQF